MVVRGGEEKKKGETKKERRGHRGWIDGGFDFTISFVCFL